MNEKLKMQNAKLKNRLALVGLFFNFSFLILN